MAQRHPDNAVYVSGDGLVSFDQYGRKLDSLGNVARGDYQTVSGAGGRRIERQEAPPPPPPVRVVYDPLASANTGLPSQFTPPQRQTSTPATLLPGGVDPATGRKVQTYYNTVMAPPGDDYFMRNPQPQPAQQWRPPPPGSTAYAQPGQPGRPAQAWRPQSVDPVLPTQRYTYSDPFAYSDPLGGARSYGPYNPLAGQPSGMPFRDPMSGGPMPQRPSGHQAEPPFALPFANGFNPSVYDPYP